MNFPGDISEETDIIYYVDCLDNRYECGNRFAAKQFGALWRLYFERNPIIVWTGAKP